MFTFFGKKKISAEKVSKQFIANLIESTEHGFVELSGLINDDVAFETKPTVAENHYQPFLLIVLAANFKLLPTFFKDDRDMLIIEHSLAYLNEIFGYEIDFEQKIKETQTLMSRINHPSKNILYAMPKAIFEVYKLNEYQKEYFKNLKTPDPTFLKRMDELMPHFFWHWEDLLKKYRIAK
ncbi:MAG: hypothetical protein ACJAUV_000088 [Flavobacteriales bacterium]|jgi:hypothetical protein